MANRNSEQTKGLYTTADAAQDLLSSLAKEHKYGGYKVVLDSRSQEIACRFWDGGGGKKGRVSLHVKTKLISGGHVIFKEWRKLELWKLDARAYRAGPMEWNLTMSRKAEVQWKKDTKLQSYPRAGAHTQPPKNIMTELNFLWGVKFPFEEAAEVTSR